MNNLLSYESSVFLDLMEDDCLLICAKGLGLDRILLKTIEAFCQPENLVLFLNTIPEEQQYFVDELTAKGVTLLPRVITADVSTSDREKLYLQGGVFFITSRILVVDMLIKRLPIEYVSGIVVQRAHKVGQSSQEGFILRMYREANSDGFIKGFSDSPTSFMIGFSHVERVMKQLFVKKLFLRPRFHADIVACLEKHKPKVIELSVSLTPLMTRIQLSIMDMIEVCIRELKKSAPMLDTEEITLENSLLNTFDKILKLQLDPQWNQINSKTKQLVSDLKVLRTLLTYLTQYDCITFYNFLQSLHSNNVSQDSFWMFLDAANSVFVNAKARVFGVEKCKKSGNKSSNEIFESSPKWDALMEVLRDIEAEKKEDSANNILICASDERTCHQLRNVMCSGVQSVLKKLFENSSLNKEDKTAFTNSKKSKRTKLDNELTKDIKLDFLNNFEISQDFQVDILPECSVVLHPLSGNTNPYGLLRKLFDLKPRFVILYDAQMQFVRQLEVFKASHPTLSLEVYFLVYNGSVEEQRYLTTLRKEKDAFELLIQQKADMIIPEERQAKTETAKLSLRGTPNIEGPANTRKLGGRKVQNTKSKKIVVDMREFRSELPSLIHKRGIDIEPVTLEVGDYILSPDMCVERKSVSDLVGSLNNGRLYIQCVAMTRFYKRAILLIEFDESKSFSLQNKKSLSNEVSLQNISSKLTLLTVHFPKLRIIWSESPHLTAEIFEDLKTNCEEPNGHVAMAVNVEEGEAVNELLHNMMPVDMLQKFPGINSKNYRLLLNKYKDVHELVNDCNETLGERLKNPSNASKFYDFVSKEHDFTQTHIKQKK